MSGLLLMEKIANHTYGGTKLTSISTSANKMSQSVTGIQNKINVITVGFSFTYTNSNGTAMAMFANILIKDTTSGVILYNSTPYKEVVSGFNSTVVFTITAKCLPPVGTTYTIEAFEANSGGGVYSTSNGTLTVSVS